MKYSIWHILFLVFVLIVLVGIFLVVSMSFFFYQFNVERVVKERITTLEIISNAIAGPFLTFREPLYPGTIENIFRETLKTPGIVFIRTVDLKTQTIKESGNKKETGRKIDNLPLFKRNVEVRDGEFQGEAIKEFSLKARDGTNLWMGVSLENIKKDILFTTIVFGGILLILFIITIFIIFIVFHYFIITPLFLLVESFEKLKRKNYQVRLGKAPIREIQKVFQSFNEMAKDLGESHRALEEAKASLEIKVEARTKELKELAESLDVKVKERTKELQEKMEELERFQRIAIGREQRMIELKEEIKKLKEELEKLKNKK
jgi:methyl-accepting chemotaxis protein